MSLIVKFNIFILVSILFFLSCSSKSNKASVDTPVISYKVKKGPPLRPNEWNCYNVEEEKICLPVKWNLIKQNNFLLMANLHDMDSNAYFVVLKYSKLVTGFTASKYEKQIYSVLKKDVRQEFNGYKLTKATYSDKEVFSGEFYNSIGQQKYVTYSTVLEKGDDLFEIALKVNESKANAYKEIYNDILFNFYHKNKLIFSADDKINGFEIVDINKL